MIEISDPVYFLAYFIAMCGGVKYMAENKSYIGVNVSDKCRRLLLIFSFKENKISIISVVSQIYLYIMLALFVISKVIPPEVIAVVSNDINELLSKLAFIHIAVIFPVGMIESSICEWQFKRRG
ncbi:MAG: hypothetical protein VB078_05500 [Clostridiaceae bacterium]|nr:hypothetical protein [Clostridiaceae bacterium]